MKEIKSIIIKHSKLGEIEIHSEISKEAQERIGDLYNYEKRIKYYYGDIKKNENGSFYLSNIGVITDENINVGFMNNSKGCKNVISVITNRSACEDIEVYPSSVLCVIYIDSKQFNT